jgi:uncharacterized protein YciI
MPGRFVFFYLMTAAPERVRPLVPAHVAYWKDAHLDDYMGGPFADRSGGLITFSAGDIAEAARIVEADPFVTGDVVRSRWVKEWAPE